MHIVHLLQWTKNYTHTRAKTESPKTLQLSLNQKGIDVPEPQYSNCNLGKNEAFIKFCRYTVVCIYSSEMNWKLKFEYQCFILMVRIWMHVHVTVKFYIAYKLFEWDQCHAYRRFYLADQATQKNISNPIAVAQIRCPYLPASTTDTTTVIIK